MGIFTKILLFTGIAGITATGFYASYAGAGLQKLSEKKMISQGGVAPGHRTVRGGGYRFGK